MASAGRRHAPPILLAPPPAPEILPSCPDPADGGDEPIGWFDADRAAEPEVAFEDGWTGSASFDHPPRLLLWTAVAVAVVVVAIALLLVGRDTAPRAHAAAAPSQSAHAPDVKASVPDTPRTTPAPPPEGVSSVEETSVIAEPPRTRTRRSERGAAPVALKRSATGKRAAPSRPRAATAPTRKGTLMVSTKPPCEIVIDGVATVLNTPQRALELPAGKHTLTLFNLRYDVDLTMEIVIEPNKTTKVIRDLMPRRERFR